MGDIEAIVHELREQEQRVSSNYAPFSTHYALFALDREPGSLTGILRPSQNSIGSQTQMWMGVIEAIVHADVI